jgi:EpsI family protein
MSDTVEPAPEKLAAPSRRDLLIGGMLAGAAGIAWAREPEHRIASIGSNQLEKVVPLKVGAWTYQSASGIVLPPPDQLARMLYDQQVARAYSSPAEPDVMLVMAYGSGQSGALQVHRPEICYPASGYRLTHKDEETLTLGNGKAIPIRTFSAESDTRTEQVLYWSRIGDSLPTSWSGQRTAIMKQNLRGNIPDGLLVRVSTISTDRDGAMDMLRRFCRAMFAASGPKGRLQLVGPEFA